MKNRTLFYCLLLFPFTLLGKIDTVPTIQPSIMVIPFVKESQQLRTVLENDLNLRVAVSKVKEGFDKRGFSTIDFRAKLKQLSNDKAMEADNQSNIKQEIIELSGADIYVETEAKTVTTATGNSVTIIITAYDAFSGQSLANKVSSSPKFYTENYEILTEKAVASVIEDFLNTIQMKFNDVVKNGRILTMNITLGQNSNVDMDSEVGTEKISLAENIEKWLEKNTLNGYYHLQGVTATKMIIDELRVPLKENNTNFRPTKFAASFRNYLKTLGIESTRDVQGNKIFITINN